jgi:hypothetical protein
VRRPAIARRGSPAEHRFPDRGAAAGFRKRTRRSGGETHLARGRAGAILKPGAAHPLSHPLPPVTSSERRTEIVSALTTISRAELDADPGARLWALVDYLAEHPRAQSRDDVRPFWVVYAYASEVDNGGHLQFFHNRGTIEAAETIQALRSIGASKQAELLGACLRQVEREPVPRVGSLDEYSTLAEDRSFSDEDHEYYRQQPDVLELLERHHARLLEELVGVVG